MRPQTPNRGAADERVAIVAKIKRMVKAGTFDAAALIAWIADRDVRAAARPGGLGRKTVKN